MARFSGDERKESTWNSISSKLSFKNKEEIKKFSDEGNYVFLDRTLKISQGKFLKQEENDKRKNWSFRKEDRKMERAEVQ